MSNTKKPKKGNDLSTGILYRDKYCRDPSSCRSLRRIYDDHSPYIIYLGETKLNKKNRYPCGCVIWDVDNLQYEEFAIIDHIIWKRCFPSLAPGEGNQKFSFRFSKRKS